MTANRWAFELNFAQTMSATRRTHFITSILSTTLLLYVFALLGLVIYVSHNLSKHLKENILLQLTLSKETTGAEQQQISNYLSKADFVKSYTYIDSSAAARDFINETGQDFIQDLGYNPLSGSFDVYLKEAYSSAEQVSEIKADLKKFTSITDFRFQESLVAQINDTFNSVTPVLTGLALLFFFISILLINNSVRLNIFSQRFLIKSMQYVGATRGFIIKPFVIRAIWNGLIAGTIASICIFNSTYILLYLMPYLDTVLPDFDRSINLPLLVLITLVLAAAGMLLNALSTWISTRKYLKTKIEELY